MPSALLLAIALSAPLTLASPLHAEVPHDEVARELHLQPPSGNGVEVRVWLESIARVDNLYRILKTDEGVSVERYAFTEVVHPADGQFTAKEAERETKLNRKYLKEEHCAGPITETANCMACRITLSGTEPMWSALFDDLLLDELRKLEPQGQHVCPGFIVVDGEAVTIEVHEMGARRSVTYANPEVCCPTVGCAIADHVRSVLRSGVR